MKKDKSTRKKQRNGLFKALDMEWNATAASYPVKCPKCGSMNTK